MSNLNLYRTYRNKFGLQIVGRMRAFGKEKRVHKEKESPVPWSSLNRKRLSQGAVELFRAIHEKDEVARMRAEAWLIVHLASNIQRHAKANRWKIGLTDHQARAMSEIVLYPRIYGELLTDQAAADIAGVSRSKYQSNWKPKLEDFDRWPSSWVDELER